MTPFSSLRPLTPRFHEFEYVASVADCCPVVGEEPPPEEPDLFLIDTADLVDAFDIPIYETGNRWFPDDPLAFSALLLWSRTNDPSVTGVRTLEAVFILDEDFEIGDILDVTSYVRAHEEPVYFFVTGEGLTPSFGIWEVPLGLPIQEADGGVASEWIMDNPNSEMRVFIFVVDSGGYDFGLIADDAFGFYVPDPTTGSGLFTLSNVLPVLNE